MASYDLPYLLFTELFGSFLFYSVILSVSSPIPIAVSLLAAIYFGGVISGGAFNPAVTLMMYMKDDISGYHATAYIITQLIAAILALWWVSHTTKKGIFKKASALTPF